MAPAQPVIFLHIGAMKTGTTFLQQLMSSNHVELAEAGYLFPGGRWSEQAKATRDILGMTNDPRLKAATAGKWARLSSAMLEYDGKASIFSMEFLSFARQERAQQVVDSLPGATVHVILTVRDAIGAIPAQWQTYARNGGTASWPAFAKAVMASRPRSKGPAAKTFLRAQGIPRILDVWGRVVPAERVHVVTVPQAGAPPRLLWERFASVVGVDPEIAQMPGTRDNTSLGYVSADLMRRINKHLGPVPTSDYHSTMKSYLAQRVLRPQTVGQKKATNSRSVDEFAVDWNRRTRSAIAASGAQFVGDLDDLPLEFAPGDPVELTEPPAEQSLVVAAAALDGMNRLVRKRAKKLRNLGIEGPGIKRQGIKGHTTPERWSGAQSPVEAATAEIATQARLAIDLRRRLLDHQQGLGA